MCGGGDLVEGRQGGVCLLRAGKSAVRVVHVAPDALREAQRWEKRTRKMKKCTCTLSIGLWLCRVNVMKEC